MHVHHNSMMYDMCTLCIQELVHLKQFICMSSPFIISRM